MNSTRVCWDTFWIFRSGQLVVLPPPQLRNLKIFGNFTKKPCFLPLNFAKVLGIDRKCFLGALGRARRAFARVRALWGWKTSKIHKKSIIWEQIPYCALAGWCLTNDWFWRFFMIFASFLWFLSLNSTKALEIDRKCFLGALGTCVTHFRAFPRSLGLENLQNSQKKQ